MILILLIRDGVCLLILVLLALTFFMAWVCSNMHGPSLNF